MKRLLLILITFTCLVAMAKEEHFESNLTPEQFEVLREKKIETLINQEINTIKRVRRPNSQLQYRLFELMSEKVKLFKKRDNRTFIAAKMKKGNKVCRKQHFKKTLSLYKETQAYGHRILKNYPHTRNKAAIYYTLATNSRDFAYDRKELSYLRQAIKFSKHEPQIQYVARTSLAEYYYNQKNWKSAVYNYEIVLKNNEDEWYTKNLLNYGWCQLKNHKFDIAINSLEKAYQLSKNADFIDVREQTMTGLINFYVLGKQIDKGIKFIDKNVESTNKARYFFKYAQKTASKGFFQQSEILVSLTHKNIDKEKQKELYSDLKLFEFDLYLDFHKEGQLMEVATSFPKQPFNQYQKEDAIRKVSKYVGDMQIILKKDFSKHSKEYDKKNLAKILTLFDTLSLLTPGKLAEYQFFKAETQYSVSEFKDALYEYKNSLASLKKDIKGLRRKNVDSIFSCIEQINFSSKEKDQELEFAYNKHIEFWPKDKKARTIYPRLFALHLKNKKYSSANTVLMNYAKAFPRDIQKQRDLLRAHIDQLIAKKDTTLLALTIKELRAGKLDFSKAEIDKSEEILANILFNNFKSLNSKGESTKALAGYQNVHFTEYYPKTIRANAAFNMGMIYTDLKDHNNALKWYQKSFDLFSKKEKNEKRTYLERMALRTELLQNFLYASRINTFILEKYCTEKKRNQKIFTSLIRNNLANDYITRTLYIIKSYKKCLTSVFNETLEEVMTHLYDNSHNDVLIAFIKEYKLETIFPEKTSEYLEALYWSQYDLDQNLKNRYYWILRTYKTESAKRLITAVTKYIKFEKEIQSFSNQAITINVENPDPNKFSKKLQIRLAKIPNLIEHANGIFSLKHGHISVIVYDNLTALSLNLADELREYRFPIQDQNFQKQFKSQMNLFATSFEQKAKYFQRQTQNLVEKNELLILARNESHIGFNVLSISDIRPQASLYAITYELE